MLSVSPLTCACLFQLLGVRSLSAATLDDGSAEHEHSDSAEATSAQLIAAMGPVSGNPTDASAMT